MSDRSVFAVLNSFIELSNRCRDRKELDAVFAGHLEDFGFDMYVFSLVRHQNDSDGHAVFSSYPEEWLRHYAANNYMRIDPIYRLGWEKSGVFSWDSIEAERPLSKSERRLMAEADDAGLRSGAAVAIHLGYGRMAGFGFASSTSQTLSRDHCSQLYAMAGQFQLVHESLGPKAETPEIRLSARQREVLQWAAAGKSRSAIGEIMGISDDTVDDHFRQIFRKLQCNDRVVAVLRAVQMGVISI